MCKLVRADCVPLTDAFNFTDFVVGSPLGRFDGDIYRHYFYTVTHARTRCMRPSRFGHRGG